NPPTGYSWGRAFSTGNATTLTGAAATTMTAVRTVPPGDDMVNVLLMYRPGLDGSPYYGTLFVSVLERNYGRAWRAGVWAGTPGRKTPQEVLALVRTYGQPLRFFTDSKEISDAVQALKRQDPSVRVDVELINPWPPA